MNGRHHVHAPEQAQAAPVPSVRMRTDRPEQAEVPSGRVARPVHVPSAGKVTARRDPAVRSGLLEKTETARRDLVVHSGPVLVKAHVLLERRVTVRRDPVVHSGPAPAKVHGHSVRRVIAPMDPKDHSVPARKKVVVRSAPTATVLIANAVNDRLPHRRTGVVPISESRLARRSGAQQAAMKVNANHSSARAPIARGNSARVSRRKRRHQANRNQQPA